MQAVIYTRFSPGRDRAHSTSCEVQLEVCRQYVNNVGGIVLADYRDESTSGGTCAKNRPGLSKAIDHAIRAKAALVVAKLDRMARSVIHAWDIAEQLKKHGAGLVLVDLRADTSDPTGKCLFSVMAAFAELERDMISRRTRDSMQYLQRNGRLMGGTAPFGWAPHPDNPEHGTAENPKRLVMNPDEQAVLAIIMAMHDRGAGTWEITKHLKRIGAPSRGVRWHNTSVSRIVRNTLRDRLAEKENRYDRRCGIERSRIRS